MKTTTLLFAAFIIACASCDQHSWKETQGLHEGMHKAHGSGHGDAHAKPADGHQAAPEHKEAAKEPAKH
jgi:hypothetical protein